MIILVIGEIIWIFVSLRERSGKMFETGNNYGNLYRRDGYG